MKNLKNLVMPAKIVVMFTMALVMTIAVFVPIAGALSVIFPSVEFNDVIEFPIFVILMFITYISFVIASGHFLEMD
jgi:hypothetical protein